VEDALKTRGIIYLNVETSLLFAPPIKLSGYVPGSMVYILPHDEAKLDVRYTNTKWVGI